MNYSKKVVIKEDLTYEKLINKYSEEYLYSIYLGYYPDTKKMYKSPFQEEKTPSFNFYTKDGKLKFKDYSSTNTGTVVDLVMILYNLSFIEALVKIYNDCNGNPNDKIILRPRIIDKLETKIEVITKDFTQEDYDYWEQYYFDLNILNKYNIKACNQVWLTTGNKNYLWYDYKSNNPCYRYIFNKQYKCYKPLETNKTLKWLNKCNNYDNIQGIEQLTKGDTLIITKSYKDVICFNEFIGIPSIAFHGEGHYIDERVIIWLKKQYKNIFIVYDNDTTGVTQAYKLSKLYNIPYKYIPSSYVEKDLSDFIKNHGIKESKKLINKILK